jgi:putative phosphoesterase
MRVLLISDIHGNWPALEAIREKCDMCLCLGDLVDYGCEPGPVIDWVRKKADVCIRGNHDHMVAQNVVTNGTGGFRYLSGVTRGLSRERTTPQQRRYLAGLPVTQFLNIDGMNIMLVHATPRDPLDEFAPADVEFWKRRVEGLNVDLVCVGHTHYQYLLDVGRTRILNPGSVGLPRDGDWRAAYAILEFGHISVHRVEYPVERTLAALESSPLPDLAKKSLAELYKTGQLQNGNHKPKGEPAEPANTERG